MTNEIREKDYFTNPDGMKLFRTIHRSNESLKAVVFLCHGLFEHCQANYYSMIIKPLNEIGCLVIAHDHRGHGLSEGERGMIYDFESLVRDVLLDIDDVIEKQKIEAHVPIFIYGHSMGGLIAICATLRRKNFFRGMVLEAPLLDNPGKIGQFTLMFGRLINYIYPTFEIFKIDLNMISRNNDYNRSLKNDELRIQSNVSVRTLMNLLNGLLANQSCWNQIETPFMIGHGSADELCGIEGSKSLMQVCSISDKALIEYPNAKHQLRNEIDNVDIEFRDAILEWIKAKINV